MLIKLILAKIIILFFFFLKMSRVGYSRRKLIVFKDYLQMFSSTSTSLDDEKAPMWKKKFFRRISHFLNKINWIYCICNCICINCKEMLN